MKGEPCIVVIGASAGGLNAFKTFLKAVKPDTNLAYIILQHLDPDHKSMLPELLNSGSAIPVVEITNGLQIESNKVYVLPSHAVPSLDEGKFKLNSRNDNSSFHLIDEFFESIAKKHGERATGVILSGTGNDGTRGLMAIKNAHGITFAQDPTSAEWSGMPSSAIEHGAVDFVLGPREIAEKIHDLSLADAPLKKQDCVSTESEEKHISNILQALQHQEGMDFSHYKKNTIFRRVKRRMLLGNIESLEDYTANLKDNNHEITKLFNDLLIPVTNFFRDQKTFDYLNKQVFPKILAGKGNQEPVRIWVAGCSTGQEAYSIAISLKDYMQKAGEDNPYGERYSDLVDRIKIFATDLSRVAINKARKGLYSSTEINFLSSKQLKAYFNKTPKGYQIIKEIREMCVFAEHDFLNDFPFGSMNMVSCRNVLIYMDKVLQKKAFINFHYALNPKGILVLGNSETISSAPDLFETIDKKHKIYRRSDSAKKSIASVSKKKFKMPGLSATGSYDKEPNSKTANTILLENYTPEAVVVDNNLDLISIHGNMGKYLEHTSGKASNNFLKLAKGSLGLETRYLIKQLQNGGIVPQSQRDIRLHYNEVDYSLDLEVRPMPTEDQQYLVVFKENIISQVENHQNSETPNKQKDAHIKSLQAELKDLRESMLIALEEHQNTEEDLQTVNEELMSGTEELQTLNEELETSKEELQSTVEEITVINQELSGLNALLSHEKKFSETVIRTIRDPLLVLNKNHEVIMANNSFYKNFKVEEGDTIGKSIYELGNGQWNIEKLHTLLESILPKRFNSFDYEVTHDFESLGKRTMLLNAQTLKQDKSSESSILIAFEDITERKEAQAKLKESMNTHLEFVNSSPWPIAILRGKDHIIDIVNDAALAAWRRDRTIEGMALIDAIPELKNQGYMELLDRVFETGESHEDFEMPTTFIDKEGKRDVEYFDFIYQPQRSSDGTIVGVSIISTIVTSQVVLGKKIQKSEEQFKQLANQIPDMITSYDLQEDTLYFNKSWLDYAGEDFEIIVREDWYSLVHPDDLGKLKLLNRELEKDCTYFEVEIRIRNKEGEYFWHLNRTHCVKDENGNVIKWIGTNTQIQRLKDEEKRKEDFLKLVSHELKTPVTSIKGYVQMLLGMINKDPEKSLKDLPVKSSLDRVDNQVTRLTRLISEILDVSKMNESKLDLNLEVFDICDLVEDTIQDVKHSCDSVIIESEYEKGSYVNADKDRIGQVIINFITNAIKYSPESDIVEIRVYTESNYVYVSVKDFGIGIKEEDLPRVFERFYRVSGKNEATYAGFGIGLYLAKNIIERHDGEVSAKSTLGEGSTFEFRLPKYENKS